MSDKEVEKLWEILSSITFDEVEDGDMVLSEDWHTFGKGTEREEIWHFFDEEHSKGVHYLLYEYVFSYERGISNDNY